MQEKIYKHFKGDLYRYLYDARSSDNPELTFVVYQKLKTGEIWIRKKEEFFSKIDKNKYPNASQEWRFELVSNNSAELKIKKLEGNDLELPKYETELSAGMDLKACINEPIILKPFQRALIKTGIAIALPKNCEAQIRSRSGIALKNGIIVLNSPGTIDADYRGEICVILINLGDKDYVIERGMRIAQLVINTIEQLKVVEVKELDNTERGNNGFGSTGV